MRKPSTRRVALAGATSLLVAGLAMASGAANANDEPHPWHVVQTDASSYTLDGFVVEYLPAGLEEHGMNAKSATDRDGGRTSDLIWHTGADEVHGKITVIRNPDLTTLDDLRDAHYGHLTDDQLTQVDTKGRTTYLAEGTGDMFWLEEPGVAITTYLTPDTWDADELGRLAAGIEPQEQIPESGEAPAGEPSAGTGGNEASEQPTAHDLELPTDLSVAKIRECLTEQNSDTSAKADASPNWNDTDQATQQDAIRKCAARFEIDTTVIDEAITAITEDGSSEDAAQPGTTPQPNQPATVRDALSWTLPAVPLNS